MERLTIEQEMRVEQFAAWLEEIVGLEDLFPPDVAGTREPIPEPVPKLPPLQQSIGVVTLRHAIEDDSLALVAA